MSKKEFATLRVKGFDIKVEWWKDRTGNHVNVEFPAFRKRTASNGRLVRLSMRDVCLAFPHYFRFADDGDGGTCLEYSEGGGFEQKAGCGRKIMVEEKSPRRVIIRIRGHEIRVAASADGVNCLALLLPKESVDGVFTLHDLCLALPRKFGFDRRSNHTRIRCKR